MQYLAFDLLYAKGNVLTDRSIERRRKKLEASSVTAHASKLRRPENKSKTCTMDQVTG